jgi:hypothetical protein
MSDVKNFDELNASTITTMIYSNMFFNLPNLFKKLPLEKNVDIVYTKKQKNIDKKKLVAPYGSIISIQTKNFIRGINTRRSVKQWCTICRPTVTVNNREKKVLSCSEVLHPTEDDISEIKYFCSKCNKTYKGSELKKIGHFLNQTTFDFSIGDGFLNVMIFKDSIKVAGCKSEDDAKNMIHFLWSAYFCPMIANNIEVATLKEGSSKPSFTIETVMKNYGFNLGFGILREPLNLLMNDDKYSDKIYMSEYESTGHTNVNIKMFSEKPDDFKYKNIEYENFETCTPTIRDVEDIFGKKVSKKKGEYVTFIVFSSSEVILSGKYTENMRELYNFFRKIINENKEMLREQLLE